MNASAIGPGPVQGLSPGRAWFHPASALRARFWKWLEARQPPSDSITLTQRNVYILPTRPGFMLGATLLLLLVSSINYQLNLGYLLTFLLAGSALVGMHVCHATLRGLAMHVIAPDAVFTGSTAVIGVNLQNPRRSPRYAIGLAVLGTDQWVWSDVPAQGSATVHVAFKPGRRGLHALPTLSAETRFPLGTFRVWTVWRPAAQVLVYPAPEALAPALPPGEPRAGAVAAGQRHESGEFDGVRAYRRGDPLKMIVWKKAAKTDELVSRDAEQVQRFELWLDQRYSGVADPEQQLSRLCAWVLRAEQLGLDYGLRLNALEIKPASGETHKKRCLQALALA